MDFTSWVFFRVNCDDCDCGADARGTDIGVKTKNEAYGVPKVRQAEALAVSEWEEEAFHVMFGYGRSTMGKEDARGRPVEQCNQANTNAAGYQATWLLELIAGAADQQTNRPLKHQPHPRGGCLQWSQGWKSLMVNMSHWLFRAFPHCTFRRRTGAQAQWPKANRSYRS